MSFKKKEAEQLLVDCGRRCCICGKLHKVQIHHIRPKDKGGSDEIDNAIPLCPNCHDEVHTEYTIGKVTRIYSESELQLHKQRIIEQVKLEGEWKPGSADWEKDKELILFFTQCLDRPAFRTYFHQELSFQAFDKAMEDTLIAFNTGYWRMRDDTLIERGKGKSLVINPEWRMKLDEIVLIIEKIRAKFSEALGLNRMLMEFDRHSHYRNSADIDYMMNGFRNNNQLSQWMDTQRQQAIDIMNSILDEIGMHPLSGFHER